jgi:hypothetical protein
MILAAFWEWLTSLDRGVVVLGLLVAAGTILAVTGIIAAAWRHVRQSADRARLVREMLERGMSAEQIARVLLAAQLAGGEEEEGEDEEALVGAESSLEVRLVKVLSNNHYDADDVNRILSAARVNGQIDETTFCIVRPLAEGWAEAEHIVEILETRRAQLGPAATA